MSEEFTVIDALLETVEPIALREVNKLNAELVKENAEMKITISNLLGELAGNTCIMCNYLERADCYDKKTEQQATINTLCDALDELAKDVGKEECAEEIALAAKHRTK